MISAVSLDFHTENFQGFIQKSEERKILVERSDCVAETACRANGSKDKDVNRASRQMGEKRADHVTSEQTVCQIRVEFASEAQDHIE